MNEKFYPTTVKEMIEVLEKFPEQMEVKMYDNNGQYCGSGITLSPHKDVLIVFPAYLYKR